jgi:hypothetical protein
VANKPAVVLANGAPGGQTIVGGTAAGENLTLRSTSHASKGTVVVGDTGQLSCNASGVWLGGPASWDIHRFSGEWLYRGFDASSDSLRLGTPNGSSAISMWNVGANLLILAKVATAIPLTAKGAVGQTANLFQCVDSAGNTKFAIEADGDIRTSRASPATPPGSVTAKLPVYDASGTLLGFLPIYDSIS